MVSRPNGGSADCRMREHKGFNLSYQADNCMSHWANADYRSLFQLLWRAPTQSFVYDNFVFLHT